MNLSNELKVGIVLAASALIFFLGVRYFDDVPLFSGRYDLFTEFDDAAGLVAGNAVTVNGVKVGSVESVRLLPETKQVRVALAIDDDITIPEGSAAEVSGIAALGNIQVAIDLGPGTNPPLGDGDFVPSAGGSDLLGDLSDRAPALVARADSLLTGASGTFTEVNTLLSDPDSDLRQTLVALRGSADALNGLLRTEQQRLGRILENAEQITGDLGTFTDAQGDSLGQAVDNLNEALRRLSGNLAALEGTTASLDEVLGKINRGEGTLGRLVNDDALYVKLDSTLSNVNALLTDFENDPARYLRELRLVDVF